MPHDFLRELNILFEDIEARCLVHFHAFAVKILPSACYVLQRSYLSKTGSAPDACMLHQAFLVFTSTAAKRQKLMSSPAQRTSFYFQERWFCYVLLKIISFVDKNRPC